jgi:CO/xanthine dehydrogenase FAD-binding subunit
MQAFAYARPTTLREAVALLERHGPDARLLAGGTDLIIRLRDGTLRPAVVVDLKRVAELRPGIAAAGGRLVIAATTVMADIADDRTVRRDFVALAEASAVVGSAQIRNRATLGGNLCNASPAADTAPPLLVYGATLMVVGPAGERRLPLDEFFVRSGETALRRGELVRAVELPLPNRRRGAVHLRRTRRRGHDLASVTLSCLIDDAGVTRIAYGSVGPRPLLRVDDSGVLADPTSPDERRDEVLGRMLADASPSPRSMRAGPDYRLAMLRVLGVRAIRIARERLAGAASARSADD